MPGRDGTGPLGQGAMTGRGLGMCNSDSPVYRNGIGRGFNRAYNCRRLYCYNQANSKEVLIEQKAILETRLEHINKQLNDN